MANKINDKKINSGMGEALFSDRERFEMWFSENWKKAAVISLGIVVAISAAFGIAGHIKESRAQGAAELSAAATVDALKAALEKNASNPAAAVARLRMANMLFDAGRYSDAIVYLEQIAQDKNADTVLTETAKLNIAKALELSGKLEDAAKAFSASAAAANNNFAIKSEAGFSAARLYAKLGKTAAALEEIQNIESARDANAMSPYADDASTLKIAIENGEYGKIR